MIAPPERSAERDAALDLVLPHVADLGWTRSALRRAAGPDADLLFPGEAADMVEAYVDLMDRRMVERAAPVLAAQRLTQRGRTLIATRLALAAGHSVFGTTIEVYRLLALGMLVVPGHAAAITSGQPAPRPAEVMSFIRALADAGGSNA